MAIDLDANPLLLGCNQARRSPVIRLQYDVQISCNSSWHLPIEYLANRLLMPAILNFSTLLNYVHQL